jgi:hypothetical protein
VRAAGPLFGGGRFFGYNLSRGNALAKDARMSLGTWADIALMFIILETLVVVAIPLVLFALFARGMMLANEKIRDFMPMLQIYSQQMAESTDQISERITDPLIEAHAQAARWEGRWTRIWQAVRRDSAVDARADAAATAQPGIYDDPYGRKG